MYYFCSFRHNFMCEAHLFLVGIILCHTSTILCDTPNIFSVIFKINLVMLSICFVVRIISSPRVINHSVIFTFSYPVLWINCLWCITQLLTSIILEIILSLLQYHIHSYYSLVSHVHYSFCDLHYSICHPYLYANELLRFTHDVMSLCCCVSQP